MVYFSTPKVIGHVCMIDCCCMSIMFTFTKIFYPYTRWSVSTVLGNDLNYLRVFVKSSPQNGQNFSRTILPWNT